MKIFPNKKILFAALLLGSSLPLATAEIIQSSHHNFRIETIVEGLSHPWALARLPDGRFLITERGGRLLLLERAGGEPVEIQDVPPVVVRGQGGLLDLVLHPNYESNGWIYMSYVKELDEGGNTTVVRARLDGTRLVDLQPIFEPRQDQAPTRPIHFGSRLAFDADGYLFFSIGDNGGPTNPTNPAQDLGRVAGKIHRLHDDGRVPQDNPFVDQSDAMPSVWTYGSRNAQGLHYDAATGLLWSTEHGPRGGDELNLIRRGANLGWPLVTHGINYNRTPITEHTSLPGMDDPVVDWTPSIAASGLALYSGGPFTHWQGNLFAGGLVLQKLVRLELDGETVTGQEILLKGSGRVRDVRVFGDGFVYVVYDAPGKVVRLVPAD
jgi:glucose/arabinose dehydrogenase